MLLSRPIFLVALVGLLAASCNSAVVTTPYGLAATAPHLPPALVAGAPLESVQSYDVAPRQRDLALLESQALAYDVAPRRLVAALGPAAVTESSPPAASPSAAAPVEAPPAPPPATKALLGPLPFISQTLNNCGPASVAEVLSFWGINRGQAEVQSVLRGDGNPYGMTPAGVPSYVASVGLDVLLGTAGTADLMKDLLRAGFPVIVNQTVSASDLEFHYRPLDGFDEDRGVFISSDPLIGPEYAMSYREFEATWGYTGHRFMVIFPPDKHDELNAALAAGQWDAAYAEGGGQAQAWSGPGNGPAPITVPLIAAKPASGWYTGPVKFGLKASDQSGFGVAATSYAVDKQPWQVYRGEFTIQDPGSHTVTFRSVNFSGSREADKTVEIGIDEAPPTTTATLDGTRDASGVYRGSPRLTLSANDDLSGVAGTTYALDGGPAQPYNAPISVPAGTHIISYASIDRAGNQEGGKTLSVSVQAGSPAGTSSPAANGRTAGAGSPPTAGAAPAATQPAAASAPVAQPAGGYSICPLFDQTRANKVGVPITIRLQLCDAAGKNLSSAGVALTVQSVIGPPTGFKPVLPPPFRYDASLNGYQTEEPAAMGAGTYLLYFVASGDSATHSVQFRIG